MKEEKKDFEGRYLQCYEQLSEIDLTSRAQRLGAKISGSSLAIPFYGKPYFVSTDGIIDAAGKQPNFAIRLVLCSYILHCPDPAPEDDEWVTYREFKGAGPLVGHFTANTNKTIETAFGGNLTALKKAGKSIGGVLSEKTPSYDISIRFTFLPRIPVLLHFNDKDDPFPAQCSILLKKSAEKYLDLECLSIGGTYLAGHLIGHRD